MELSPNGILTQQPEKMAFLPDLRIACMTPILFDNRPPVLLVSCLTGGLWRYDLTSAESQPQAHRIANLQEHSAVFCICHDKRTNFIIAGLANGCIAVLTREQVLDTSDPVSVSILKQLGDGKAPVSDICLYDGRLWCACGSQVYVVKRERGRYSRRVSKCLTGKGVVWCGVVWCGVVWCVCVCVCVCVCARARARARMRRRTCACLTARSTHSEIVSGERTCDEISHFFGFTLLVPVGI